MMGAVLWDGKVPVMDFNAIFQPYQKQTEFILAPARNRYFCAGRGAGKSWTLALDVLVQVLANGGKQGAFLGRTEGDLKQNLLPYFIQHTDTLRNATGYDLIKRYSAGDQMVEMRNGSSFRFRGYENVDKIRQFSFCWVDMDEVNWTRVSFEQIMRAVKPTLRIPGPRPGLAVASSPNGLAGFTKLFWQHQIKKTPGWYVTRCPSHANPYLDPADLQDWFESMSADAWKSEVLAMALRPVEVVYHQFKKHKHVIGTNWQEVLASGGKLIFGVDWGLNHAAAIAVVVDTRGVWYVVEELVCEPQSRGHFQEQLAKFIRKFNTVPYLFACDRAVPQETTVLRNTWGKLKSIVAVCDSKKEQEIAGGVSLVQGMLDPASNRQPKLFFSDELTQFDDDKTSGIIPAMQNYKFAKHPDGTLSDRPIKDDKYDHVADALRMLVVCGARFPDLHAGRLPRHDVPDGWHGDDKSSPHRAHF